MSLVELKSDQYFTIPRNKSIARFPLINAVISGKQEGRVFLGNSKELFIIHKAAFSFVSTIEDSESANSFIDFLSNSENIPVYFHIYDPFPTLISLLNENQDAFNLKVRKRIQLRLRSKELTPTSLTAPRDLQIRSINSSNFDSLTELGLELDRKFWNSRHDFLMNGFGVCILNSENTAVCVCYSACIADRVAEIDIKTHIDYQRMGLAIITVNEFIKISLGKGITPNWDCFIDNIASVETAIKAGFKVTHEYTFLSVFNKKKNL